MYRYLNGRIAEKTPATVILDVGGVGYEVRISVNTFSKLPDLGQTAKILTHFIVREDAQLLYGFFDEEEKELFKLLLSVSGVGPKMAMTLLSGMTLAELKNAIAASAIAVLSSVSGVGKKTAERVAVELKDKLPKNSGAENLGIQHNKNISEQILEDAASALVSLGYTKQKAKEVMQKILKENPEYKWTVEEMIRKALKHV